MTDSIEGFRLSPQQERLWSLRQDASAFGAQCIIRIEGNLKVELLKDALRKAMAQHDSLRTAFYFISTVKMPIQVVNDEALFDWRVVDLQGKASADQLVEIEKETKRPFDLTRGPLVRVLLLSLSAQQHLLAITLPSLIADGDSLSNLFHALAGLYSSGAWRADEAPIMAYAQYAEWQNQMVANESDELDKEYWRECSIWADAPATLPFEAIKPNETAINLASHAIRLPASLGLKLDPIAKEYASSVGQLLLACWVSLLWRLTRQSNMVVAIAFDGRTYEELSETIGLYAKYLPAYYRLHEGAKYSEVLSQVQKTEKYLEEIQDGFSYGKLQMPPGKEVSFLPFAFDFERRCDPIEAGGVLFSLSQRSAHSDQFKIKLSCVFQNDELLVDFSYDPALFAMDDIQRLAQQFHVIAESAANNPDELISALDILSEDERRALLYEFNKTKACYSEREYCHKFFEEQVRSTPDRIAIIFQDEHITFSELNARSNQIAHCLKKTGVEPEAVVAVLLERSPILIASILGALKSGGAYVPLDPSYPKERLDFMLADSNASVLLTERGLANVYSVPDMQVIYLDQALDTLIEESDESLAIPVEPENLAYLIYTSGSTGKPKGAMITHRGLRNYLAWARGAYQVSEGKGSLVHSSISFDLTITALFSPLLAGASVTLLPEKATIEELAQALNGEIAYHLVKITPTHMTALNNLLTDSAPKRRSRVLVVGGEALKGEAVNAWRAHTKDCRIINEYGPTETVVGSSMFEVSEHEQSDGPVPIGSPIANTQLYLLDPQLQPVPINAPGELHIGGEGVARGYFNRPEVTAEKFIPHPFSDQAGARLYKTGDETKRLANGAIVFLGRVDQMVKVRGYRVEPGEIESALCQHPAVAEAVVIPTEDSSGDTRLVAYYVPESRFSSANGQLSLYRLPNGLEIVHINKNETDLLYRDIFIDESYLQCGISLSNGAVVFDVGANIGLFTLYISQKLRDVLIYAFEPVPPIYEKLKTNVDLHRANARLFNCGASNQTREANITYYPRASAMSGIYADTKEERNLTMGFLTNQDPSLAEYSDDFLEGRFESESFTGQFKRLSDIIKENEIDCVDLLKIDVEKSELDVLLGIDSEDWGKIKQIVIEIHDIDGRLNKISELLGSKGYEVNVRQELLLERTNLYNLYAIQRSWALKGGAANKNTGLSAQKNVSAFISTIELRNFIASKLPDYMIPSSFVRLDSLPLNANGKLDRKALPQPDQLRPEISQSFVAPRTNAEKILADIWKHALRIGEVGVKDNFFELGGDSILTIQVVAKAKLAGLHLVPKQMFQYQTVEELALIAKVAESPLVEQGLIVGAVPLTPIQRYFFDQDLLDPHHFNQSVLLEMQQDIDPCMLRDALDSLTTHHDALRMRYEKTGAGWRQTIAPSISATIFSEIELSGLQEQAQPVAIEQAAGQIQTSLNLLDGPLLRACLFNSGSGKPAHLFFAVHHLIIDGVSWRILLEDLATAYQQLSSRSAIELPAKTTSFKRWAIRLVEYARSDAVLEELPFWLRQAKSEPASYSVEDAQLEKNNTFGAACALRTTLGRDETQALLQEVSKFYHVQINEVLLTAMAVAFSRRKGSRTLRVDVEGHGREEIFDDADTSRTIGWFTTIFPVTIEFPTTALIDASFVINALTCVKEQLRMIPRKGIGYGLLRHLNDSAEIFEQLSRISKSEVAFNYLGRFDSLASNSFFIPARSRGDRHVSKPARTTPISV